MDSVFQLMLLDNHRYCVALIAGNLDLITGGTWQAKRKGNISTIQLKETRLNLPKLMLVTNFNPNDEAEWDAKIGKQRALLLSPYELDRSLGIQHIYYAFSNDSNTFPKHTDYTPSQDENQLFTRVIVPPQAQYVFIRTSLSPDQPIYRFHIGNSQRAVLVLNNQASREPLNLTLAYNYKTRTLADTRHEEEWGQPEKVSPAEQAQAWQNCQPKAPVLVRRVTSSEQSVVEPDILPDK